MASGETLLKHARSADSAGMDPHGDTGARALRSDGGFTLIELLVVVLIIGILVSIAVPVYADVQSNARRRACFANQRTIQGAVHYYTATHQVALADLAGVVDETHPLVVGALVQSPPRCTAAPSPVTPGAIDAAHGGYTIDTDGSVEPCVFAGHGLYSE